MSGPLTHAAWRFWRIWWTFALASAFATVLMLVVGWCLEGIWRRTGDDMPPVMAIVLAVRSWSFSLLLGLVVAAFGPAVAGPRFPFLRWGYLLVAVIPVAYAAVSGDGWDPPFLLDAQVTLLVTMLIFIWMGRGALVVRSDGVHPD